jgi:hypothetical protein
MQKKEFGLYSVEMDPTQITKDHSKIMQLIKSQRNSIVLISQIHS